MAGPYGFEPSSLGLEPRVLPITTTDPLWKRFQDSNLGMSESKSDALDQLG